MMLFFTNRGSAFIVSILLLLFFFGIQACQKAPDEGGMLAVLTVSKVSPTSGPQGSTVTISGSKFGAIPDSNRVFFGGVPAKVVSGDETSLTVMVPKGAPATSVVMVKNGSETASSADPFTVSAISVKSFSPAYVEPDGVVTLNAAGFSKVLSDNRITVNGVAQTITSIGDSSIVFKLTGDVFSGKIFLTVGDDSVSTSEELKIYNPRIGKVNTGLIARNEAFVIQGSGFNPETGKTTVWIGDDAQEIVSVSFSEVKVRMKNVAYNLDAPLSLKVGNKVIDLAHFTSIADFTASIDRIVTNAGVLFSSLTTDQSGNVFAGNSGTDLSQPAILHYTSSGELKGAYGKRRVNNGEYLEKDGPTQLAYLDKNIRSIAADYDDCYVLEGSGTYTAVRKVELARNNITTVFSASSGAAIADGAAGSTARFKDPQSIAFIPRLQELFLEDDRSIRRISSSKVVETLQTDADGVNILKGDSTMYQITDKNAAFVAEIRSSGASSQVILKKYQSGAIAAYCTIKPTDLKGVFAYTDFSGMLFTYDQLGTFSMIDLKNSVIYQVVGTESAIRHRIKLTSNPGLKRFKAVANAYNSFSTFYLADDHNIFRLKFTYD